MDTKSPYRIALALFFLIFALVPLRAAASGDKEQKEKIERMAVQLEELKTEIIMLQRQVQSMQDTFNKTTGELNTLIVQISDNISGIRRAQSAVSTNGNDTVAQISAMGERITATNDRLERLSEQFAQLKKLIEDIPKQPTFAQITPGNPEQLFAAAYSDYSRGNYSLALSEFQQYVETYPSSELADNAQYWIGETLYAQKKPQEALDAFARVAGINPKGDKVTIALYKRALVLAEIGRREDAVAQLRALLKAYPKSREAVLAKQQLQQWLPVQATSPP